MSWAEVFKINKNMKRALNEQIQDLKCTPIRVITSTGTYTPEKTGLYKVICVGAGADGVALYGSSYYRLVGGGGGGVAIKDLHLSSESSYAVTVSTTASFSNELSATGGTTSYFSGGAPTSPVGGIASGGDYNFDGITGELLSNQTNLATTARGGSVGVYITELHRSYILSETRTVNTEPITIFSKSGDCLLSFGGGGASTQYGKDAIGFTKGFPAGIIIIPLEMEE